MQSTSTAWRENQANQLTSEGLLKVSYIVTDPDLAEASVDARSPLYLSSLPNIPNPPLIDEIEREVTPYATLEQDLWLLDGNKETVPENGEYGYSGYISEDLCDDIGMFNTNPVIRIEFRQTVKILPGLTITWGEAHGDYPVRFKVTPCLAENNAVVTQYDSWEVRNNADVISVVAFKMADFNQVDIEILEWNMPFRRARACKIFMGIRKVYSKDNLLKFSSTQSVDPVTASLPKYEITVELDNRDRVFDPQNEDGLARYMMERQKIKTQYGYRFGDSEEWIPGGEYYLSEWSAPRNGLSASFKARDLFGFMNEVYIDDKYNTNTTRYLGPLIADVLGKADLPKQSDGSDPWIIHPSLNNIPTTAPLPDCSLAECVQLIANAACCVIFFDSEGKLHIEPQNDAADEFVIDEDHSYSRAEISIVKPIKQINVSVFDYSQDSEKPTEEIIPVNNINGTYRETGEKGEIYLLKNNLITTQGRAKAVGIWLYKNLFKRKTASLNWRVDPSLYALDLAKIVENPNDENGMNVLITSADLSFTGSFTGKSEGVVIE